MSNFIANHFLGGMVALITIAGVLFLSGAKSKEPVSDDLQQILDQLESDDEYTRLAAIVALGDFPDQLKQTSVIACKYSAGRDPLEQTAAEMAFKKMGPELIQHLGPAFNSNDLLLIDGACNAYGLFGEQPEELAQPLLELVKSDDDNRIFAGLKALQGMGSNAKPIVGRVTQLLGHSNFNIQLRACNVLAALGGDAEPALEELLKLAVEGNLSTRSSTLPALGAIGTNSDDPRILKTLSKNLNAFHALAKERAFLGISRMGPRAKSLLPEIERLMNDKSKSVMPEAAYTYWRVSGQVEPALETLRSHASSATYQNRILLQISKIGEPAHPLTDIAIQNLDSPEAATRESAVLALEAIGNKASEALKRLESISKNDDDVLVRLAARHAIQVISRAEDE